MLGEFTTYSPDREVASDKGLIEELQGCAMWVGQEANREGGPRPKALRLLEHVMCEACAVLLSRDRERRQRRLFGRPVNLTFSQEE